VLRDLGARRALVVHGRDGMDEISLCAPTLVAELDAGGGLREYELDPARFGLAACTADDLKVADAAQSRERILEALADTPGPARDIVALNAGAALYVAGVAGSIAEGLVRANAVLASGAARARLDEYVALTRRLAAGDASGAGQ
jgi:anthranilate phosphoribosyltransferase